MGWLARVVPLVLSFTAACAHVEEVRVRQVLDDESVRLTETPRPELSHARVKATLSGGGLALLVRAESRCLVQFAERIRTRERVRRPPSAAALAAEASLMAIGLAVGIGLRRGSSADGDLDGGDVVGVTALAVGMGSGVALGVDASRYSDTEVESTRLVPEAAPRVVPCERRGTRPTRAELITPAGRRFVTLLDGMGRGGVRLPDDIWVDDQVDFDVKVDGALVQRLVIVRPQ